MAKSRVMTGQTAVQAFPRIATCTSKPASSLESPSCGASAAPTKAELNKKTVDPIPASLDKTLKTASSAPQNSFVRRAGKHINDD
jgi:hypothetical protein